MTPQKKLAMKTTLAILSVLLLVTAGCSSNERPPNCRFGSLVPFGVLYTLTTTPANPAGCDTQADTLNDTDSANYVNLNGGLLNNAVLPSGGIPFNTWGFEQYYDDYNDLGLKGASWRPGELAYDCDDSNPICQGPPATGSTRVGLGNFQDFDPDSSGVCTVPAFTSVTSPTDAPVGVTYNLANVRILTTDQNPGTQLAGDLQYTDGAGLTCTYTILAVWPATICLTDADCAPGAINSITVIYNGLAANFPTTCQSLGSADQIGMCLLSGAFPVVTPQ